MKFRVKLEVCFLVDLGDGDVLFRFCLELFVWICVYDLRDYDLVLLVWFIRYFFEVVYSIFLV